MVSGKRLNLSLVVSFFIAVTRVALGFKWNNNNGNIRPDTETIVSDAGAHVNICRSDRAIQK